MDKNLFENEISCMTEEMLKRCGNQEIANEIYSSLLQSYGLVDLSKYDGNDETFVGKPELISADYPSYYGGAYINDKGNLIVLVTAPIDDCRDTIEKISQKENFIVKHCQYSYKELLEVKEKIQKIHNDNLESNIFKNITAYGVSDSENLIFVEMEVLSKEHIQLFKEKISNFPMIAFRHGEKVVTESTVNAGIGVRNPVGGRSSVGFRANTGGVRGFVMSGHGARARNSNITLDSNNAALGRVIGFQWSGSVDAAFVQVNNNVTLSNAIANASANHSSSFAASAVGTFIFQSGITTRLTSGTITTVGVNVNVSGVPMTGMVRATYSSAAGDSGGIVYRVNGSQRPILGIHVASGPVYGTAANIQNSFRVVPF